MDQGTGQGQLLFHPSREFPGLPVFERFYLYINIPDQIVVFLDVCPKNGGIEIQVFLHGQILVKGKTTRHVANDFPYFFKILDNIEIFDQAIS